MNPLCVEVGLPESSARIALRACLGTWRGGWLLCFFHFVFLFARSSPADSSVMLGFGSICDSALWARVVEDGDWQLW